MYIAIFQYIIYNYVHIEKFTNYQLLGYYAIIEQWEISSVL